LAFPAGRARPEVLRAPPAPAARIPGAQPAPRAFPGLVSRAWARLRECPRASLARAWEAVCLRRPLTP